MGPQSGQGREVVRMRCVELSTCIAARSTFPAGGEGWVHAKTHAPRHATMCQWGAIVFTAVLFAVRLAGMGAASLDLR